MQVVVRPVCSPRLSPTESTWCVMQCLIRQRITPTFEQLKYIETVIGKINLTGSVEPVSLELLYFTFHCLD